MLVLNGAKIRQLAGGRSRTDVKRGFAVVEVGGNTQYFVAASSREYANWVGTITATIAEYTNADDNANRNDENEFEIERVEDTMTMPEAVEQEGPAVEETSAERNARFSGRIIGAKSRMGAALETAKQRGKQIAEQRRDRQAGGRADDESASGSIPYDSQETANAADAPKRRIQFGKAFSGVKEATKNKLGAAIQNARQKDREEDQLGGGNTPPRPFAGVRNRLNRTTTADIGSDVGDDRSDTIKAPNDPVQWECEACTFINTSTSNGSDCCEMCGNSAPQNINGAPSVVGQNAGRGDQVEEEPTTEGGKRIRLGAIGNAVRNARQNRLERRREAVDNNVSRMFHDESSFILKRVHAGNQPPMSVSENVPVIHLKNLEGIWSVSVNVKSHVTSNDCRVKQPEDNQASSDSGTNGSPQTWDQDIPCFLVQSTRLDEPSGTIQREIGYSTLMNLHSMISESIGDVLEKVASRGAESEASTDDGEARNDLWAERLVEQVLIAGRALDCILDSSLSGERLTRVITYQGKSMSGARSNQRMRLSFSF